MKHNQHSQQITVFHGRKAPEGGTLVGYGALIDSLRLSMPLPDKLALISTKNRQYTDSQWLVLTPRHEPEDNLYKQLVFALKYEGLNLLFFKKLFQQLSKEEVTTLVQIEPTGQYSRKIWILCEWLMDSKLNIPDLTQGNFVNLVDEEMQYASSTPIKSSRHRINNNLAGTVDFCPLIFKTEKLENFIGKINPDSIKTTIDGFRKDILLRTSSFLLLKDSKASFSTSVFFAGNMSPVFLWVITSLFPIMSVQITGSCMAAASNKTLGKPSLCEGWTKTSAKAM